MTEQNTNTPPASGGGMGYVVSGCLLAIAVTGFVIGYKTHEGLAKASIDDFGKVKLQDHIYEVTLLRAPFVPKVTTMAQRQAERAAKAAAAAEGGE